MGLFSYFNGQGSGSIGKMIAANASKGSMPSGGGFNATAWGGGSQASTSGGSGDPAPGINATGHTQEWFDKHPDKQSTKVYNADNDAATPGGTGLGFLNGLSYQGRSLDNPGRLIDPTRGNKTQFNGPFMQAAFLRGEMGPGGYLSEAGQNSAIARDVHGAAEAGRSEGRQFMDSALGTGLNRRYAVGGARDIGLQTSQRATEVFNAGKANTDEMRFDSMQEFINMTVQSAQRQKEAKLNKYAVKKGAEATKDAGVMSAIGSTVGAVGGAAIMASDRRLKTNIVERGSHNGHKLYTWNWKDSGEPGFGFMAQEVEKTAPQHVYKAVDYGALMGEG